jgi:membrane-associated phospholipid phosphatase
MRILVATSRMYRGEHHPTDILGSLIFSALWLAAVTVVPRKLPVLLQVMLPGRERSCCPR